MNKHTVKPYTTSRFNFRFLMALALGAIISLPSLAQSISTEQQTPIERAKQAIDSRDYVQAKQLYKAISQSNTTKIEGLFGLAKVAFYQNELDDAEDYISDVLELSQKSKTVTPDYYFIAGRIAGKQAQEASIFTKLSYAKDTKQYFEKALALDPSYQPAYTGLVRFHQQAPVMAGGDKDKISGLIAQLRQFDKRAAFTLEAPILLENNQVDTAMRLFDAIKDTHISIDSTDFSRTQFDFAMQLSAYGHYQLALEQMLSIDINQENAQTDYAKMRLYQIGKLTAESNTQLEKGISFIMQYMNLPASEQTIPSDWVQFRLAQLRFLLNQSQQETQALAQIRSTTDDKDLKKKITSLLSNKQV